MANYNLNHKIVLDEILLHQPYAVQKYHDQQIPPPPNLPQNL